MYRHSKVVPSSTGAAEATQIMCSGDRFQVSAKRITTGTGTLTITVKPGTDTEYRSIVNGTIDLTAPIPLIIEGRVNAVKAVSDSGSDVYELEVMS